MKVIVTAILLINSTQLLATDTRKSCAAPVSNAGTKTLADYSAELQANNVNVVPGNTVQPANVDVFLQHYNKFPAPLRSEMVQRGARITIMEGEGVKSDPTFTFAQTWDGRDWSKVPGSGGEVSQHHNIPTRIVVNSLYHNHGSSDLLLHEHAHTLDSLYSRHGVSESPAWTNIMSAAPSHMEMASLLCGTYCSENPEEAFAELFAYYFSCDATKKHMEEKAPKLADFFKNLTSVRDLLDGNPQRAVASVQPVPVNSAATTQVPVATGAEVKEDCDPTPISDIVAPIKPLSTLTPYLKNYPVPGSKPNPFQISYPVYPSQKSTGVSAAGIK